MKKALVLLRIVTAAALVLFLILAPANLGRTLQHNFYREWLAGEPPDWNGVLTLWHVVGFKTYQGSVTAYLESCAAQMEKKHTGVYVEVLGLTEEALKERYARGERPDIWSFPSGAFGEDAFAPLSGAFKLPDFAGNLTPLTMEGEPTAVPYLYSGYYLMGNSALLQKWGMTFPDQGVYERMLAGDYAPLTALLQEAMAQKATARYGALCAPPLLAARLGLNGKFASEGDFKAGQVPFMIGDARACGDLARKMPNGGFTFDVLPLGGFTEQVQYIGMGAAAAGKRAVYAEEYISLLMTEAAQLKLTALGALPSVELIDAPRYADGEQQRFYEAYRLPIAPSPALYAKKREALALAAKHAAESGELAEFKALLTELIQ